MRKAVVVIEATLLMIFFITMNSYASETELGLFDEGYQYYLSYQPKEAVDSFHFFLKKFPNSSVKDAALFWLGRSLVKLQSFEDAKKIFLQLKDEIPDSPFKGYVDHELKTINSQAPEISSVPQIEQGYSEIQALREEKALAEKTLSELTEERDNLRLLLEEEKMKKEESEAMEKTNAERDSASQFEQACSEIQALREEKALAEKTLLELTEERDDLRLLLEEEKLEKQEFKARADRFDSELRDILARLHALQTDHESEHSRLTIPQDLNDAHDPAPQEAMSFAPETGNNKGVTKDSMQVVERKPEKQPETIHEVQKEPVVARRVSSHTLELIANEETWIYVTIDDKETRERILKPGARIKWTAKSGFSLKIGNAGGIKVLFNGREIGPLGDKGKVVKLKLPSLKISTSQRQLSNVL